MRKEYYNDIKTRLSTISDLRHVGRWKSDTNNPDTIHATPAAYVEFLPMQYESKTRLLQVSVNVQFVVHLVHYKYTTDDSEGDFMFELSQEIYKKLQTEKNYERLSETIDTSVEQLEDWQLTYVINRVIDEDAQPATTIIEKPDMEIL